jgi:AcrR family transcriptional regulator
MECDQRIPLVSLLDEPMARPPSAKAHEAVLSTALKLMGDRGIEGTSVDEIAEVSGVSKATIYKHWASKEALCIEAISRLKCDLPVFDSGKPRADVTELLRHLALTKKPEAFSRIWPRVIGYAASNPAFAKAFRARIADGRRAQLARLLQRAIDRGELRAGFDVGIAMDTLLGPILYRRFIQAAVPPELPEYVVDSFWRLNAPESSARPGKREKPGNSTNGKRPNALADHRNSLRRRVG